LKTQHEQCVASLERIRSPGDQRALFDEEQRMYQQTLAYLGERSRFLLEWTASDVLRS